MRHLLREYGFLTVLVLAGVGAYFLYEHHAGNLLDASLDSIGVRLKGMMERPEDEAYASNLFDTFRERVRSREISPEELERVTANILNMSRSGASITPDEARLLFEVAALSPDSMAVLTGGAGHAAHAPPPSWEEAGEDVVAALAFDKALAETVRDSTFRSKLWFDSKHGLKLVLEDTLRSVIDAKSMEAFARELDKLQKRDQLVWTRTKSVPPTNPSVKSTEIDSVMEDLPDRIMAKRALLIKLQALEKKGYAPPADVDSLLDALDRRVHLLVEMTVDSALSAERPKASTHVD